MWQYSKLKKNKNKKNKKKYQLKISNFDKKFKKFNIDKTQKPKLWKKTQTLKQRKLWQNSRTHIGTN